MKRFSLLFALLLQSLWPTLSHAATCSASSCYVTPSGGSGTRDGTDWNKALSAADLVSGVNQTTPSSRLTRGSTYYLAAGSYGSIAIDDPVNGSAWIKVYKATQSNSGSVAGWSSAYAGPAVFESIIIATNYVELNGQERDESAWSDGTKYGFRVSTNIGVHWDNYRQDLPTVPRPEGGDFITIKYVNIGYPEGSDFSTSMGRGISVVAGSSGGKHDYIITNNYIHHTREPVHFTGNCFNVTVDRNYIGPSWGKETIMALWGGWDFTISNNVLIDNCQDILSDPTADGCTTEISGWSNGAGDKFDRWQIFGNIIARKNAKDTNHTDAVVLGGYAAQVTGWRVYNNVIAGMATAGLQRALIKITGSGNKVYNNLWYDIGAGANVGCSLDAGSECSNNWCFTGSTASCGVQGAGSVVGTGDPFLDYPGGNFSLKTNATARNAGRNLTGLPEFAGGAIDLLNHVRGADGGWDIGALEQGNAVSNAPPMAPGNLRAQ